MEDIKKENSNKAKRLKLDRIKQIACSYLQKRNYSNVIPEEYYLKEYMRFRTAINKVSQPNVLFFACWNNKEALVIDNNYNKFISWLKEVKMKSGPTGLDNLAGPLFCYMYLELLRKGLSEQAGAFFRMHISSIDLQKCDDNVKELISAAANNATELNGIRDTFRSNKYTVRLSSAACILLKKFLLSKCHIVFLQMLALWFQIHEIKEIEDEDKEDEETEDVGEKMETKCDLSTFKSRFRKPLIVSPNDIYSIQISNVKEDVTCGLINRNSGTVVYCHSNSTHVRSIRTLKTLHNESCKEMVLRNHTGPIYDIEMVKKYNLLVTASFDRTIYVCNLQNYTKHDIFRGHTYPVYSISSSSNGAYLVSGSYDATIRLWSLQKSRTLRVYAGHKQEITHLDFHPNSAYFASCSADKAVRMWTVSDPMPVRLFYGSEGPIYCVKFSPNGRLIACGGEDKLRVWDLLSSKQLIEVKCGKEPVTEICWSADQNTLVTGSIGGIVRKWNMRGLLANPTDTKLHEPSSSFTIPHSKILHIECTNETFNCLTTQSEASTFAEK